MKWSSLRFEDHRVVLLLLAWLLLGAKCTDIDYNDPKVYGDENLAATMTELNAAWREGYRQMLAEIGTHTYNLEPAAAFAGMRKVLEGMGYKVTQAEGDYYLAVSIEAERMFTGEEWDRIRDEDEPEMRTIATRHLGIKGRFAELQPDGLLIKGVVTVLEQGGKSTISITFRLFPIKPMPPESILPRREYPPPFAARTGYEKIWRAFEQQVLPMARMSG